MVTNLSEPELYVYPMHDLVEKSLRAMLIDGMVRHGGERNLCAAIGWAPRRVKALLQATLRADLAGPAAVELSAEWLAGDSYIAARQRLEGLVINAFMALEPHMQQREVARFFRIDEKKVRRFKAP